MQTTRHTVTSVKYGTPPPAAKISDDPGHAKPVSFKLGDSRVAALDAKAAELGMSRSELVRWMIDAALIRKDCTIV